MRAISALIVAVMWHVHALAARYSDAIEGNSEEFIARFSDEATLALCVFVGLAAFVLFTWDDKRVLLRWGSRTCMALALAFLVTEPALLAIFIFGPFALFFLWPVINWIAGKVKR